MSSTWPYPHAAAHGVPAEVLADLRARIGPYVLIGSHARDVVTRGLLGMDLTMPRTSDLDVAVAVVNTGDDYEALVSGLNRTPGSRLQYRLPDLPDIPIDIIPFGDLHDLQRIPVGIRRDDERTLDATGLAEAARCALTVDLSGALTVRVPPVHALIALKLIAFGLRIEMHETKDARDQARRWHSITQRIDWPMVIADLADGMTRPDACPFVVDPTPPRP